MTDTGYLEKLSKLRLSMKHKASQNLSGNRKSIKKGSSTEFSDFREYIPGDDPKRIDWNAYGRLDKLYIKEYMEEKEAVTTILIDTSASMDFGAINKKELVKKLALSFSYITLNQSDKVVLIDLKHINAPFTVSGGKKAIPKVMNFLDQLTFEGTVNINGLTGRLPVKSPGITFVISDFFQEELLDSKDNIRRLCSFLQYKKQKPVFLQVLAGEEVNIELSGTYRLIDAENNSTLRLTLENKSIQAYENALSAFQNTLSKETNRVGGAFYPCHTFTSFDYLMLKELRFIYDF